MDQMKIGGFIRQLRKEKELTQEQLAEQFAVSRRTVSRWETGSNLPDLDILIEMSEFFGVGLRQLLDGERSGESGGTEEGLLKVAGYSKAQSEKVTRRMHWLFIVGTAASLLYLFLYFTEREDNFLGGFCQGVTLGMMIVGVIITSRRAAKIRAAKMRLWGKIKNMIK